MQLNFGQQDPKKHYAQKYFGSNKFWFPKYFESKKGLDPKVNCGKKKYLIQKIEGPEKFHWKQIVAKKNLFLCDDDLNKSLILIKFDTEDPSFVVLWY